MDSYGGAVNVERNKISAPRGNGERAKQDGCSVLDLSKKTAETYLRENELGHLFDRSIPLILPDKMNLSSISYKDQCLRIIAIKRHQHTIRQVDMDQEVFNEKISEMINYRAYITQYHRAYVSFEWNFLSNTAMVQISRLPTEQSYLQVLEDFKTLTKSWLDLTYFQRKPLHKVISKLNEQTFRRRVRAVFCSVFF